MIGEVIRKWRTMSELSLKEAALQIGVSYVTLHNIEKGGKSDGETTIKLIKWLFERQDNGGPEKL